MKTFVKTTNDPFHDNEFNMKDFSENYTVYKGKPRDTSLKNWNFDRFNNVFHFEIHDYLQNIEYTMIVFFSKIKGKWLAYFNADSNVLESACFDEFADAINYGNQIYNNKANNLVV